MKIVSIVGVRPNFVKIASLHKVFQEKQSVHSRIVHTGQHYDHAMNHAFFEELQIPPPHYNLGIKTPSATRRLGEMIQKLDPVFTAEKPDLVVVVGDVDSTLAGALAANKGGIPLAHIEAGLRSFSDEMPEETNRKLTDHLAQYLFATETHAVRNLKKEGISADRIHFVGNLMIDTLVLNRGRIKRINLAENPGISFDSFVLMTMHRPENVDKKESLDLLADTLETLTEALPVVFPIHPRTSKNLDKFGLRRLFEGIKNLKIIPPQSYLTFLKLVEKATLVITDSGGLQEETTFLGVPCLTLRRSTERPSTIETGTNTLLPNWNPTAVRSVLDKILNGQYKKGGIPALWDGKSACRVAEILLN